MARRFALIDRDPAVTVTELVPVQERAFGGGIEGAERTSREMMNWQPAIISPDRQINRGKDLADARARDAVQNDGYLMGAVQTHRDSIVGSEYRLNAQPDYEALGADEAWRDEFQTVVESRFNLVANSPENWLDAQRTNTLTGLVRLALSSFMIHGEVLGAAEWVREADRPCKSAIQMISPTRLTNPDMRSDEVNLRKGIEFTLLGRPIAYWIKVGFPGDMFNPMQEFQWRRVPATKPWGRRQMIHIHEQLLPDQSRGLADMVSALKTIKMTKKFSEVTLQNAIVNASYAAAIESELPSEMVYAAMGAGAAGQGLEGVMGQYLTMMQQYLASGKNISIDGAQMPHLFPGTKLKMQPMGTPGGVGTSFEQSLLRNIAASLGVSYEQLSKDYSSTNYSSARAAMAETWKAMQSRKTIVADKFANNVYRLWLEEEINAGNVPLPKGFNAARFYLDPVAREAFYAASWIGASRGQIDELKETQSAVLRINNGLSTMEDECARLGLDWRRVLKQLAREKKMKAELDLDFSAASATKPGANQAAQTITDNGDDQDNQGEKDE